MSINSGEFNGNMFIISGLYFDNTATLIGLFAAALMMVLLYVHSEWYIVNTSAVLLVLGHSDVRNYIRSKFDYNFPNPCSHI